MGVFRILESFELSGNNKGCCRRRMLCGIGEGKQWFMLVNMIRSYMWIVCGDTLQSMMIMHCKFWLILSPSVLERIYMELEGRKEWIKYAWYCKIKMTQWLELHYTNREQTQQQPRLSSVGFKGAQWLHQKGYKEMWNFTAREFLNIMNNSV